MPHRTAEVHELCRAALPAGNALEPCKAQTDRGCPRCGLPLCPRHMPAPDARCRECEQEYGIRRRERMGHHVVAASLVLGSLCATFIGVAFLVGSVVAVLPVAAVCASTVVVMLSPGAVDRVFGRMLPRRQFLKERKHQAPPVK